MSDEFYEKLAELFRRVEDYPVPENSQFLQLWRNLQTSFLIQYMAGGSFKGVNGQVRLQAFIDFMENYFRVVNKNFSPSTQAELKQLTDFLVFAFRPYIVCLSILKRKGPSSLAEAWPDFLARWDNVEAKRVLWSIS